MKYHELERKLAKAGCLNLHVKGEPASCLVQSDNGENICDRPPQIG